MEFNKSVYITINHLDDFESLLFLRVGDKLSLRKDKKNTYDDEAIAVYNDNNYKCGYVANSVPSVVRGTCSAGRIYDRIKEEDKCIIRFIFSEKGTAIAEVTGE